MTFHPLFDNEAAYHGAAKYRCVINAADLVALAGGTGAQAIKLFTQKSGAAARCVYARLVTPFTSSDATLLSITAIVGDAGSTNRLLTSYEMLTPTPAPVASGVALSPGLYAVTTDTDVSVTLTPTSSKNLNTATAGEVHFYFDIVQPALP